jgi:hypothetical protein
MIASLLLAPCAAADDVDMQSPTTACPASRWHLSVTQVSDQHWMVAYAGHSWPLLLLPMCAYCEAVAPGGRVVILYCGVQPSSAVVWVSDWCKFDTGQWAR